jgi:hypothetical protein
VSAYETHPSEPVGYEGEYHDEAAPRVRRVRARASSRYETPEEAWAWHWTRMRIVACWTVLLTAAVICSITAVVFMAELVW